MSDDLIAFLRARLDDEQREAEPLAAQHGEPGTDLLSGDERANVANAVRVLRQVEAHRQIIDLAVRAAGLSLRDPETYGPTASAYSRAVREIAAIYSDHPDFREEWR